jgi:hypothetical protein
MDAPFLFMGPQAKEAGWFGCLCGFATAMALMAGVAGSGQVVPDDGWLVLLCGMLMHDVPLRTVSWETGQTDPWGFGLWWRIGP